LQPVAVLPGARKKIAAVCAVAETVITRWGDW
jgi:hypothetical protein